MSNPIIDPKQYNDQLAHKKQLTITEFGCFGVADCEIFESPHRHYRMRAEFKIWQDGHRASYAMYTPGETKKPFIIEQFDPGSVTINTLMPKLLTEINANETLRKKLFQAEFLTSSTGEALITLIYHKVIDDEWQVNAEKLAKTLDVKIVGRSRKKKIVIGGDSITENFTILGKTYSYKQVEASFTQPNAAVCEKMLLWVCKHMQDNTNVITDDLIELYCGNGNFTLPLSQHFRKVLATEISKASVNAAQENIRRNDLNNIAIARMSSEEFTEALNGTREFKRLKNIPLDEYHFTTIFVDPPRAGLDDLTLELINQFQNIIYISCNPATLCKNLEVLSHTHTVKEFALFDQFPYTEHRECGVILTRS